mmetsp:Transcript_31349/g.66577  ORF Transcript_31349/g.66577 Transcript_31349/m.66577 type:complete len:273 (+) Transcript_31349:471-1289(+)
MSCASQRGERVALHGAGGLAADRRLCHHHFFVFFEGCNHEIRHPHVQGGGKTPQLLHGWFRTSDQVLHTLAADLVGGIGQVLDRHALSIQKSLQCTMPGLGRISQVSSQRENLLGPNPREFSEGSADASPIGDSNDECLLVLVTAREGVRNEGGDEIAITCVHFTAMNFSMTVSIVEVHRTDKHRHLHHQVAVVHLDIWVQRVATLDDPELLNPLRTELAATAHRGISILVVGSSLPVLVQPVEHSGGGFGVVSEGQSHPSLRVVGIQPEIV